MFGLQILENEKVEFDKIVACNDNRFKLDFDGKVWNLIENKKNWQNRKKV